jgi:hypothetical protein
LWWVSSGIIRPAGLEIRWYTALRVGDPETCSWRFTVLCKLPPAAIAPPVDSGHLRLLLNPDALVTAFETENTVVISLRDTPKHENAEPTLGSAWAGASLGDTDRRIFGAVWPGNTQEPTRNWVRFCLLFAMKAKRGSFSEKRSHQVTDSKGTSIFRSAGKPLGC